jgi:threonylcarbamoyladenosine tRNA methylthiotransferase MtaB
VHVKTLGCKVNQAESDDIGREIAVLGGRAAGEDEAAVVVVNTCTVTGEADHKARKAIRHALSRPGAPYVVVTGCLAAIDAAGVSALGERVIVEPDKARVAARVAALLGERPADTLRSGDGERPADTSAPVVPERSRARVQVKVQDGCDTFCAYCIVPHARGLPRSEPMRSVVERIARLASDGVAEVVLTGINIGRYDDGAAGLPELLAEVAATGVRRVRISSIEPGDVTDRLLEVAAGTPSVCRHLHIPLQSGCDATLAAMRRPYDVATFAGVLARVREALPGVAITTDVMVGFPGETDADHQASLRFVESAGFARLHVFRYSARAGTPAAEAPGQVPPEVRAGRAAEMRAVGIAAAVSHGASMIGSRAELLAERVTRGGPGEPSRAHGTTREYAHAVAPCDDARPGDLIDIVIDAVRPDGSLEARQQP